MSKSLCALREISELKIVCANMMLTLYQCLRFSFVTAWYIILVLYHLFFSIKTYLAQNLSDDIRAIVFSRITNLEKTKWLAGGRTLTRIDRQTDEKDFIGSCPTNVERSIICCKCGTLPHGGCIFFSKNYCFSFYWVSLVSKHVCN